MAYRKRISRQRWRSIQPFFSAVFSSRFGKWAIPAGVVIPTKSEWGRFLVAKAYLFKKTDPLCEWVEKNFIQGRDAGSTPADARVAPATVDQYGRSEASWFALSGDRGPFLPIGLSASTLGVFFTR